MTIGIDASRANLDKKTGVEFYSYFLIQELKKMISEPHQVILYSPEPLCGELANLPANWQWKEVKTPIKLSIDNFIGAGFRGRKRPFLWTQLGLSLEMLRRPPDVLFVPSHALPFICPKNSFVTIHDIGFDRFPESYHWLARWYHRLVTRFAVWRAKKIITISEFTKKELIDIYQASPEKIVAIPNGYDSARFHTNLDENKKQEVLRKYDLTPPPQSSPLERGRKEGDGYIFYVGRLEKKKNILTLIKAFEFLREAEPRVAPAAEVWPRNIQLVLAGSPGYGFAEIEEAIEQSPVRDRIKILNYISNEDLPYLMSGASVFVFPSFYEGFGIPVLEAQAVGVPVVASDIPALREIATPTLLPLYKGEDQGGGYPILFANPTDPHDFAQKIHQVLTNENLHQTLISHGLRHVKKFSWAETARLTIGALTR